MKGADCLMRFISPLIITNSPCLKSIFSTLNSFLASPLSIAYSPTSSETFLIILILSSESRPSSPVSISLFLKMFFCCPAVSDNLQRFSCSRLSESNHSRLVSVVGRHYEKKKKRVLHLLGVSYCFCMRFNRIFTE